MLNMTSLGQYYFEIALILRESILVSKLLFNSEVWYNLSNKQIEKLEQIDEIYLRKILNCPKTTPKVGITFKNHRKIKKTIILLAYIA